MAVQIVKSELKALIDAGKKADEIAEHYGIPLGTARVAIKAAGFKIKRSQKPRFTLVDEEEVKAESYTSPVIQELLDPQIQEDIKKNVESHEDTTIDILPSTEVQDLPEEEVVEEETEYYDDRDYENEAAEEQEQDEIDSQEETNKLDDPNDWF